MRLRREELRNLWAGILNPTAFGAALEVPAPLAFRCAFLLPPVLFEKITTAIFLVSLLIRFARPDCLMVPAPGWNR